MTNVFTYGSLMFDPVWSGVVEGSYERLESILQGYDRKSVNGEVYPVIVPSSHDSQVPGIVYRDVSEADLSRLDRFEGEYYYRKTEEVITLDMIVVPAEVYVLKEEYYSIVSFREWDPEQFRTNDMHLFLLHYMGKYKNQ